MRLQTKVAGDETQVWELVKQCVQNYLAGHGLRNVQIVRAQVPPEPNPVSEKFCHVWAEISQTEPAHDVHLVEILPAR